GRRDGGDERRRGRHRRRSRGGPVILGRVVGFVWATRKDERLHAGKLLVVEPHGWYDPPQEGGHLVAGDPPAPGLGGRVVVSMGAVGRWGLGSVNLPVEAAVMAVVDHVEWA